MQYNGSSSLISCEKQTIRIEFLSLQGKPKHTTCRGTPSPHTSTVPLDSNRLLLTANETAWCIVLHWVTSGNMMSWYKMLISNNVCYYVWVDSTLLALRESHLTWQSKTWFRNSASAFGNQTPQPNSCMSRGRGVDSSHRVSLAEF